RAGVLADLKQAGMQPAWLPLTLDVWGTIRATLAFATFAAMALLATTLSDAARKRLLMLAMLAAIPMALLGFSQAAAGAGSPLRFFDYHHPIGAIGLFANRNHFADLLGLLLPFALAFAVHAQAGGRRPLAAAWYALAVVLLLAAALSFSRAGLALSVLAGAASLLLFRSGAARDRHALPVIALGVAGLAVATYAWDGIAARLTQDPLTDLRWQYVRYGMDALRAWMPLGSGFGSFRDVYATFEPIVAMRDVHALHAHNDLLEVLIEGGIPAGIILVLFVALLVRKAVASTDLRSTRPDDTRAGFSFGIAAAIACAVPLLHSLVDYPLRTLAIAVPFGLVLSVLFSQGVASSRPLMRSA
ncbi:MAG: O-antigen polymerase, partial [Xanthomonadaceae bacterium]|nr:O-antigen polymerase [Xanthomonadaceae bacterium]